MLVRLLHLMKAPPPILVTLSGMVISLKLLHPLKADDPMLVTPSGIMMPVRLEQLEKALAAIPVTSLPSILFGITKAPDASTTQSVIMTVSPVASYVRSLISAACVFVKNRANRPTNNKSLIS